MISVKFIEVTSHEIVFISCKLRFVWYIFKYRCVALYILSHTVYYIIPNNLALPQKRKWSGKDTRTRINQAIRASELRVVGPEGENLGTLSLTEALKKAEELKLDLIEISPKAKPPVAKITDFGQFRYDTKRKASAAKAKAHY